MPPGSGIPVYYTSPGYVNYKNGPRGNSRPRQQHRHHNSTSQPKSLPCKKLISTGICTYSNRCHYIHDVRINTSAVNKGTCRKKNKEETTEDSFFWPPMEILPNEARVYSVPSEKFGGSGAVASLWHHFVGVCMKAASKTDMNDIPVNCGNKLMNPISKRPRLSIFVELAD